MEYESRVILTQEQYLLVKEKFVTSNPNYEEITNVNYYFDTPDLYLTEHHAVLRLRKINSSNSELTLKIDLGKGCLEINQHLTDKEELEFIKNCKFKNTNIKSKLIELGVDLNSLKLITELKTERVEIQFDDYLLVIDKNYYRGKVDYNLEVESDSENHAKERLISIISQFGIEYKKDYISKSKRAIYNL